jgi:hypothetical protein
MSCGTPILDSLFSEEKARFAKTSAPDSNSVFALNRLNDSALRFLIASHHSDGERLRIGPDIVFGSTDKDNLNYR